MLIEFRVANYRSIREEQTLSMVASASKELADSHTFESGIPNVKLLSSAAIYGPNASGKTNLLRALMVMKAIVRESASEKHRGDALPIEPFKLDSVSSDKPTTFDVDFLFEGIRYQYGFSATEERITGEWLFAFPERRTQRWFEREWKNNKYQWSFGSLLKGEKELWKKSTRDNSLFLSTAIQLNSQQLQPVYDWFRTKLHIADVSGWSPRFSSSFCEKGGKKKIMSFLKEADLGIRDISVKKENFDPKKLGDGVLDNFKTKTIERLKEKKVYEIKTLHEGADGKLVEFDFDQESDGTRKMFSLAGPFLDSLQKGSTLCVDELHDNLHLELVKFLFGLFNNKKTNQGKAQLIFTTHETSILNQALVRRDQIWFCEKDKNKATRVYPLSDFRPRKGVTNMELAYLSGRYGALPYIAESQN